MASPEPARGPGPPETLRSGCVGAGPGGENGPVGGRAEGATGRGISGSGKRRCDTRRRAGFRPEAGRPPAPRERRSAGPGTDGRSTTEVAVPELEAWLRFLRFLSCEADRAGEAQGPRAASYRSRAPRAGAGLGRREGLSLRDGPTFQGQQLPFTGVGRSRRGGTGPLLRGWNRTGPLSVGHKEGKWRPWFRGGVTRCPRLSGTRTCQLSSRSLGQRPPSPEGKCHGLVSPTPASDTATTPRVPAP